METDFPARERLLTIGRRRVRVLEANRGGTTTFVIEAALGFHAAHYGWLLDFLAEHGRVIAYDRAGLGLSDPAQGPIDGERRASQLFDLVEHLELKAPLYLVGHSIGGLYLHIFAHAHPERVAGLVLLDATHPAIHTRIRTRLPYREKLAELAAEIACWMGRRELPWTPQPATDDPWRTLPGWCGDQSSEISRLVAHVRTTAAERRSHRRAAAQAAALGPLRDVPLLVISAAGRTRRELRYVKDSAAFMAVWMEAQRDLAAQSTSGRLAIVPHAGHCDLVTDPTHARAVSCLIGRFTIDDHAAEARNAKTPTDMSR